MEPSELNAPCPYCQRQCRVGMWHWCEKTPYPGEQIVKLIRRGEQIVAQLNPES